MERTVRATNKMPSWYRADNMKQFSRGANHAYCE